MKAIFKLFILNLLALALLPPVVMMISQTQNRMIPSVEIFLR